LFQNGKIQALSLIINETANLKKITINSNLLHSILVTLRDHQLT